jgi:hypothetical protein
MPYPATNKDIKEYIDHVRWYAKPAALSSTLATYSSLGLSTKGSPQRNAYIFTVVAIYQNTIAINQPRMLRDDQAWMEMAGTRCFIRTLENTAETDLEHQAILALQMLKRVIITCEVKRGFFAWLFPPY